MGWQQGGPAVHRVARMPARLARSVPARSLWSCQADNSTDVVLEWLQGDGGGRRKRKAEAAEAAEEPQKLVVESYAPADPGPYPEDLPPQNPVRFTPMQVASWLSCSYSASTCATGTCTPGCCQFRSLQSFACSGGEAAPDAGLCRGPILPKHAMHYQVLWRLMTRTHSSVGKFTSGAVLCCRWRPSRRASSTASHLSSARQVLLALPCATVQGSAPHTMFCSTCQTCLFKCMLHGA
jgi:hypothetical protein